MDSLVYRCYCGDEVKQWPFQHAVKKEIGVMDGQKQTAASSLGFISKYSFTFHHLFGLF